MSNISGTKLIHHIDRMFGSKKPITADIFLTNYCNVSCPFCTYGRWNLENVSRYMPAKEFKRYVSKLLAIGVKGVILTGGGEPTINPDFEEITNWLEDENIHYGINTNGVDIKYCKPDYMKISVDGYDRESYKAIKGYDKFDVVMQNIKDFAYWKKENSSLTSLGVQKIVTDNCEIIPFYEAVKNLDVDYIVFRPIESTMGEFYKGKSVKESLDIIKSINDERVVANYKWEKTAKVFEKCSAHWSQIALNEKGEVIYCCHKPYEIIGHIMDKDILKKHSEAKTNMLMCDIPCRLTAPNELVDEIISDKDVYFI